MTEQKILRQLVWIKWILASIALCAVTIVGSTAWSLHRARSYLAEYEEDFSEKARKLLNEDKPHEVIPLAQAHIRRKPQDGYGPWFLALAYYQSGNLQEASRWLDRTQELSPTWEAEYIKPYREAITRKRVEKQVSPKEK
jgi:cytochrome c-type biogenesis protein CcmH/NrfG